MLKHPFQFCLPTTDEIVPAGAGWFHEIKYDGYRLRIERYEKAARLITRGRRRDHQVRWRRIDCLVKNISEAGAAIEVATPLFIPDRFTVQVASESDRSALPHHLAKAKTDRYRVRLAQHPFQPQCDLLSVARS